MKRDKSAISRRKVTNPENGRSGPIKMYVLMFVCLVVVVAGFFLAARQHFSSMDYGMRNSKLRKQLDDLESEKRRLLFAREVSLSPAEIKKAAQKLGIDDVDVAAPQMASISRRANGPDSNSVSKKTYVNSATKYIVRTAYVETALKPQNTTQPRSALSGREK